MKPARKKRLKVMSLIFITAASAIGLLLYAMRGDLNHYYSLETFAKGTMPIEQAGIRVGGMVAQHSFEREGDSLKVRFKLTDYHNPALTVRYTGILPDLFREGQGIIAKGKLGRDNVFYAQEILAKHDAKYMPPEIAADMKKAGDPHALTASKKPGEAP